MRDGPRRALAAGREPLPLPWLRGPMRCPPLAAVQIVAPSTMDRDSGHVRGRLPSTVSRAQGGAARALEGCRRITGR